jgi:predicted regulator of Ras-like GTPase activity (Roadblock/LC7/MglB family)
MSSADEALRRQRLIFYEQDIQRIDGMLSDFLRVSQAKCALLVDKDGHLVTRQGSTDSYDLDTISALVAGSFAATKEMAKLLGEKEFSVMFHQGRKDNIQLSLVGDRTILAVIFDERTTLGMVRHYANQIAAKLDALFKEIAGRRGGAGVGSDFGKAAKGALDDVFGS